MVVSNKDSSRYKLQIEDIKIDKLLYMLSEKHYNEYHIEIIRHTGIANDTFQKLKH